MMEGFWLKELRNNNADFLARKFGLTPGNVTLGTEETAAGIQARMSRLPMGRPVIIQNADGSAIYLAGLDGPAPTPTP